MNILEQKLSSNFFDVLKKRLKTEIEFDGTKAFTVKCNDGEKIRFETDGRSTVYAIFPIEVDTGKHSYTDYSERRTGTLESGFTRLWIEFVCQKVDNYNAGKYENVKETRTRPREEIC